MKDRRGIGKPAALLALAFLLLAAPAPGAAFRVSGVWERPVHDGVVFYHYKGTIANQPVHAYLLLVNASRPDLRIRPMLAYDRVDRLETVPSMAKRYGALAAVNGSFFNRKESAPFPVGFLMVSGRPIFHTGHRRSAFGMTKDRSAIFGYPNAKGIVYIEASGRYVYLNGMNRPRKENDVIAYTVEYGDRTRTNEHGREVVVEKGRVTGIRVGDSPIPRDGFVLSLHGAARRHVDLFAVGERVSYYFVVDDRWVNTLDIVTGGPLLVTGGMVVRQAGLEEGLRKGHGGRIPQTAVGSMDDGRVVLAVVDGRRAGYSVGLTYDEFASFLARLGVTDAVGMDGGGSSTMVVGGEVVNRPSDGAPRRVNNGIGVLRAR
ncbi:MAG: phosphodiester glycosidase family protein [bacterium]